MDDPTIRNSAYDQTIAEITKDLADLRANLLGKLSREIITLQNHKGSLTNEIERLQAQKQALEGQIISQQSLNQQEIQRQQWIEQLAQAIALHLKADLNATNGKALKQHSDNIDYQMIHLDSALNATFQSLQRDLDSYRKDIDLQMQQMHNQKLQGEMLLSALVERLNEQLGHVRGAASIETERKATNGNGNGNGSVVSSRATAMYTASSATASATTVVPTATTMRLNNWWKGFILMLWTSVVLSLQNVFLRIVFVPSSIFFLVGTTKFGGLVTPSVTNSLMVLFIRMTFAAPAMWLVATRVFRVDVSRDIRLVLQPNQRNLLLRLVASAVLQFASFTFIYVALSMMKPAIAVTLFFIYPTVTMLLAWFLFGDRPKLQQWGVVAIIYAGIIFTYNPFGAATERPDLSGVIYALLSGISFAGYLISCQACFKSINPVSFTALNFGIIWLFCLLTTPLFWSSISLSLNPSLIIMCLLIATTTVVGYLLNNFGTKMMGAAQASIVGASGPVFTTLLAFSILSDKLKTGQILGVFLVTLGVGLLSLENMRKKKLAAKP